MNEDGQNRDSFDSGKQHLGSVYAKALLGATEKQGNTDAVLGELESLVHDVLDKLPQFAAALRTPRIATEEKIAILQKAFGGKMSPVLLNFLKVAAEHSRLDCLPSIAQESRKLVNQLRGRVAVKLQSAQPLNNQLRDLIVARLQTLLGREVDLQASVDSELLGGLVVRVGDTVYDGSLANKLNRMRSVAVERTARTMRESLDRFALS